MNDRRFSYSVAEFARQTGLSISQIRKYTRGELTPKLPTVKSGAKYLIDTDEADAWWTKMKAASTDQYVDPLPAERAS